MVEATPSQCLHDPEALADSAGPVLAADSVGDSRASTEVVAVAAAASVADSVAVEEVAVASEEVILALEGIETASADHPAEHPAEHHLVLEATAGMAIVAFPADMTREVDEASTTDPLAVTVTLVDRANVRAVVALAATWNPSDAVRVGIAKETVTVTVTARGIAIGNVIEVVATTTDRAMTTVESVRMRVVMRIPGSCVDTEPHPFHRKIHNFGMSAKTKPQASRGAFTTMELWAVLSLSAIGEGVRYQNHFLRVAFSDVITALVCNLPSFFPYITLVRV